MAVRYSGGPIVSTTFDASSRTALVDNLKAALVNAGWTTVSGSSGDWKLQSASTPAGHAIRVRLYDPGGSAVSARMRLLSADEVVAPNGDLWLKAGSGYVYRVMANKYQFMCFRDGEFSTAGTAWAAGVPWTPSWHSVARLGWAASASRSDNETSARDSWRTRPYWGDCAHAVIYGSTGLYSDSGLQHSSWLQYLAPYKAHGNADSLTGLRWPDGSILVADPLISYAVDAWGNVGRMVGQLWDAIIVADSAIGADVIIQFDSKSWRMVRYDAAATYGPWSLALLEPSA